MDNPTSSSSEKPVVYVLHGDDLLAIQRFIAGMVEKVAADPALADLNITRLDGKTASEDDLRSAAGSMPFLAERRLVIMTNPLAKANTDSTRKRFQALLDSLPDTTALALVFEDVVERGRWKSLHESHWVHRWLKQAGRRGLYHLFALPPMAEMPGWVRKEAQKQGGQFTPEAAKALAAHVSNDTRLASTEIIKLLTYVDYKRPVEAGDVEELTAEGGEADVFKMVDEIAAGNGRGAIRLLHRLLEEDDPLRLFGMIVRQFRLLIQVREVLDEGLNPAQELHLYPSMANNLTNQARRFDMADLQLIYHRLLETDEAVKSSQIPVELALETFIVELAR